MALYTGSPFGILSKSLGNTTAATWKGKPYVRTKVVPGNPRTVAQQAQRALFAFIVLFARQLLSTAIATLFNPFAKQASGYNDFCKLNLDAMATETDYPNFKIGSGSLELSTLNASQYVANTVNLGWSSVVSSNGLSTDKVAAVVIDVVNKVAFVSLGAAVREDEEVAVVVGTGRTVGNLKGYLCFYRVVDGVATLVSPTSYRQIEV